MNERYKELQQATHDMFVDCELSQYTKAIADNIYGNLYYNIGVGADRANNPGTVYEVTEGALNNVYYSLTLLTHLAKIYECNEAIERIEKRGVNNG